MRPSSMVRLYFRRSCIALRRRGSGVTLGPTTCSTEERRFTIPMRVLTANLSASAHWSRNFTAFSVNNWESASRDCRQAMIPLVVPKLRQRLADVFRTRTRDDWCDILEGTRCLFHTGTELGRGADSSAQPRTRNVCADRRYHATSTRTAFQPHTGGCPEWGVMRRFGQRRRSKRLGLERSRDRDPPGLRYHLTSTSGVVREGGASYDLGGESVLAAALYGAA